MTQPEIQLSAFLGGLVAVLRRAITQSDRIDNAVLTFLNITFTQDVHFISCLLYTSPSPRDS